MHVESKSFDGDLLAPIVESGGGREASLDAKSVFSRWQAHSSAPPTSPQLPLVPTHHISRYLRHLENIIVNLAIPIKP